MHGIIFLFMPLSGCRQPDCSIVLRGNNGIHVCEGYVNRFPKAFDSLASVCLYTLFVYCFRHFRRVLLKSLNKDLKKELKFSRKIIKDHAKNYQIWYIQFVCVCVSMYVCLVHMCM